MDAQSLTVNVQHLLDNAVRDGVVAGATVVAVDRNGKTLVQCSSGLRAVGREHAMDMDTYFPLYSMTKIITTIAALQLVHRGLLSLDEPIDHIVPELAPGVIKRLDDSGTLVDIPPDRRITLRMLLTHMSGFAYTLGPRNAILEKFMNDRDGVDRPHDFSGLKEPLFNAPLVAEPGTAWIYGASIDWVGEAIQRVTHISLGEYCQDNIFAPLDIQDMALRLSEQRKADLVGIHIRLKDGTLAPTHFQGSTLRATFDSGGHGGFATTQSYSRLLACLINGGTSPKTGAEILPRHLVERMFEDQAEVVPTWEKTIREADMDLNAVAFGANASRRGWSFAGLVNADPLPSGRKAYSACWTGAANSYFSIDPSTGVACVFMAQSLPSFDPVILKLWASIESDVYASVSAA
ncbi:beta-lactamase/transpeptidase-like protein [Exidia glandulosa HHB12029]|uniref:Beta-lactamase/transpeptidase-like protein n=1 Tax=Exidia glandulosa HHB12029 TaxID=1314781 RepID=A0A165EQ36_EXIGL|nr:beta-lactamase/transpeptidase-like protein [Exidia glandulosa HHB12029]